MGDVNHLAGEGEEALRLQVVEHVGDVQARIAEHAGQGYHAACYLLVAAMVEEIALEQRGKVLEGVALVGSPEQVVGALDAGGELVEQIVVEHLIGEEVVDDVLLADYEHTHMGEGLDGVAEALAQAEEAFGAEGAGCAEGLNEVEVLVERASRELHLSLQEEDYVAAGVILTDYLLLGAVCAEVHFYLGKDGGEVLAAVSLEEGELKQLVVDGHWS